MRTLYLVDLDGRQYGIWKDEVASIREVRTVHRLPLSPACIAGISVLDGRSTALADLAVCVGLQPVTLSGSGRAIFVAGKDADSGFVVPGTLEEADIPDDNLFPMPEYVKTAEVDTCVVYGSRPVPVINLTCLYNQLHEADPDPSVPAFTLPSIQTRGTIDRKDARILTAGGELFAVPADVTTGPAVRPGALAPLALTPTYLKGLAFHEGEVLPVVHLAERMGLPARGDGKWMMATGLSGTRFGFLVDEDKGMLPAGEIAVMPLPPVAETEWTPAVVLDRGSVIPLIDIRAVLAVGARKDAAKKPAERYAPDSRFPELFGQKDVAVVEFSLLGARHALPKSEMEDVVPIKPYRRVPDALPIVIGVTEHNGQVLPVLDLALVFGRRSLETPEWSMVLVRNGDFRAFVITERVYGERALPRDVQRKVPIILPHNLVYGCYPEGVMVRLILNVEELAVHFDKSIVKELLPALTREMAEAPAELVPSLLPGDHIQEEIKPVASFALEQAAKAEGEAAEQTRQAMEAKAEAEARGRDEEERARRDAEERARAEAEKKARRQAEERMQREAEEKARAEAEAKARAIAEARERLEAEARTKREAEEKARQEAQEAEERSRREAEERVKRDAEERAQADAEARAEQEERMRREAEAKVRSEAGEQARREAGEQERRRAEEKARAEAEERARREAEAKASQEAAAAIREAEEIKRRLKPEPAPVGARTAVLADSYQASSSPSSREIRHRKPGEGKQYALAGLAVLLIVLLVYFGVIREPRGVRIKEPTSPAMPTEVRPNETVKDTTPPASPEKPVREGPLVLTVPAERALETDLYIVKEGDTLWDICERFTGDPFNYPRVASDNRIANPDLIFPGQKIELKK